MTEEASRVAVVTGGGSGIGRGLCQSLVADGVHVVVADIDPASARAVADQLATDDVRVVATGCDVTRRSDVEALADLAWTTFGRVDMVFNNAGIIGVRNDCVDIVEDDARAVLDVNLMGVWHGCAVFGKRLAEQGTPAHIVNTSSENGIAAPIVGRAFYTASKHAVVGLSDVLRQELPAHVTVSVLCPGVVATKMTGMDGQDEPPVGLSAAEVARRAIDAARRGEFFLVTHPPVADYVRERCAELLDAFERQAPRFDGDERLDTRALVARSAAASSETP